MHQSQSHNSFYPFPSWYLYICSVPLCYLLLLSSSCAWLPTVLSGKIQLQNSWGRKLSLTLQGHKNSQILRKPAISSETDLKMVLFDIISNKMHVILIDLVNHVRLNQSINWLKCWERKDNASTFLIILKSLILFIV